MNTYTTIQSDTWDLIAFKVYGNDKLGLELLRANPDYNLTVIFPSGVVLQCPDVVNINTPASIPPWKR